MPSYGWRPWFAWRPVRTIDRGWVWLRRVRRRLVLQPPDVPADAPPDHGRPPRFRWLYRAAA